MTEWYCQLEDKTSGPFSTEELCYLRSRGKLTPDALVRQGPDDEWISAGTIKEVFPDGLGPQMLVSSGVMEPRSIVNEQDSANSESPQTPPGAAQQSMPSLGERNMELQQRDETRERIIITASIVAGILLLLLLLLLLFPFSSGGGDQGGLADGGSQGTSGSGGAGNQGGGELGEAETGESGSDTADDAAQGDDESGEEIVYEGEITEDAPPRNESVGDKPPEEDPPETAIYRVEQFVNAPPAQAQGDGGGAGGGLGDFNERLDREGGQSGEVQITLIWNNINDLDLHVICPSGERIYYSHKRSRCSGELDVDMNAGGRNSNKPVENVFWPENGAPSGQFRVLVNHYANNGARDPTKFEVAIRYGGNVKKFSGRLRIGQTKEIHSFRQQ